MKPSLLCFFLLFLACLKTVTRASCPYAKMMQNYNFSGDWVMVDDEDGTAYVLHVCQVKGNEVFFGMARNDTPDILIGFGGGNWSQWNLGVVGIRYQFYGNKIDESGFIIGMNTEGHQWWFKDNNKSFPINQTTEKWVSNEKCMVPFGHELRREKYEKFKKIRAAYHKAKRERSKKAKKSKVPVNEEEENRYEKEYNNSVAELDKSFDAILPTLINTTWKNNNYNHKISFHNALPCFSNASSTYSTHNARIWYDGVSIMSEWSSNDIRGAKFSLLLSNNEVTTSMVYSINNINETLTFIETKDEIELKCDTNNADNNKCNGNTHCEL